MGPDQEGSGKRLLRGRLVVAEGGGGATLQGGAIDGEPTGGSVAATRWPKRLRQTEGGRTVCRRFTRAMTARGSR